MSLRRCDVGLGLLKEASSCAACGACGAPVVGDCSWWWSLLPPPSMIPVVVTGGASPSQCQSHAHDTKDPEATFNH